MSADDRAKQDVVRKVKDNNVQFVRLWFTDILGFLKSFAITVDELEDALESGKGFDGSSIQGFARIDESDMIAMPDPSTFRILPWRPQDKNAVGRMFCDVLTPEGEHYECDPRWILRRNLKRAADMGYTYWIGPELEYFYFKSAEGTPEPLDKGGYFDLTPLDVASDLRRETVLALQAMGIPVEYSHHEVAPSQHEIDLRFADALTMADNAMTYRLVVKEIALLHGVYATFMPKPVLGENGSGMHTHQSLFQGDRNAFFDPDDKNHISKLAKHFIAGLLEHISEITIVLNQWVNSYKRLVPGYEAPVYKSWAVRNRSDLVRVPEYKPGKERSTRIELRSPDPACNPYLAFAVMLAAGLDGIEKEYELRAPVQRNVYEMTQQERDELGIGAIPDNLYAAVKAAENSELLEKALGIEMFSKLLDNKHIEWERYSCQVTSFELEECLGIL
jgi:glutamine synthetase